MTTLLETYVLKTAKCDFKGCVKRESNTLIDNLMDNGWAFVIFEEQDICLCEEHYKEICDLIGFKENDTDSAATP